MEDIEGSSSSDEEDEHGDVSVDQSVGESVKKYLPKPLLGRKSVFISGNLKRGGGKKQQSPKKKLGRSRKNLNPMMDRISREGEKKNVEEQKEKVEEQKEKVEEQKEKVEPRRSSGRAATKAAGQSLSPAVLQVSCKLLLYAFLSLVSMFKRAPQPTQQTFCFAAALEFDHHQNSTHAGGAGNFC